MRRQHEDRRLRVPIRMDVRGSIEQSADNARQWFATVHVSVEDPRVLGADGQGYGTASSVAGKRALEDAIATLTRRLREDDGKPERAGAAGEQDDEGEGRD